MSIDDKLKDVNPYEAPGIPFLQMGEAVTRAEKTARLLKAYASMYSLVDNPEIYKVAEEAEQRARVLRAAYEKKYHLKSRDRKPKESPNPYDLSSRF
jgi:uncharacterized alpha-E superfamily protein